MDLPALRPDYNILFEWAQIDGSLPASPHHHDRGIASANRRVEANRVFSGGEIDFNLALNRLASARVIHLAAVREINH
jgi:hypothetical protein